MRIRVDDLTEAGKTLAWQWDERQLAGFQPERDPTHIGLSRPVEVALEIRREADQVRIAGRVQIAGRLVCDRCLEEYPWELDQPFETVFFPGVETDAGEDRESVNGEVNVEFFDGELIDPERLVAEEILLALPLRSLCSEACRGLCPGCGVNLNRESCRCRPAAGVFQQLARIRKSSAEQ